MFVFIKSHCLCRKTTFGVYLPSSCPTFNQKRTKKVSRCHVTQAFVRAEENSYATRYIKLNFSK